MLRETLEDIGRCSFAEVHTSIALALWRASFFDEIDFAVSEGLEGMKVAQRRCGESPRSKLQRVSSEDLRTPVLGQAVNQSAEMRSALEFFATAQLFRERSLESVN